MKHEDLMSSVRIGTLACLSMTVTAGCSSMMPRLSEHSDQIVDKGLQAAENIMANPSTGVLLNEIGGYLAFIVAIALGGKTMADRKRFKTIENGNGKKK